MKKIIYLIFYSCFIFINTNLFSQPVASFTVVNSERCAPVNILFRNTSTGCTGNVSYFWRDGKGGESTIENPTFNYDRGGTYRVTLDITCNGQVSSASMDIVIYNSPQPYFDNTRETGCVNQYTRLFSGNLLSGSDVPIDTWQWYFGDGHVGDSQQIEHTYTTSGDYSVTLNVTDRNGCTGSWVNENIVSIATRPNVSISTNQNESCNPDHIFNFNSTVSTWSDIGYELLWDFGDGTTSSEPNPSHSYLSYGNYQVSLTVNDTYGCSTTVFLNSGIRLTESKALYTISRGPVICKEEIITFRNRTNYNCLWSFDNGSETFTSNSTMYTFYTPGQHEVKFTVDPGGTCQADTTIVLNVEEVIALYETQPADTFSCTPLTVQFINISSDNASYFSYNLGNDTLYTRDTSVRYETSGTYYPSLTVTTINGCTDTFYGNPITINNPKISLRRVPDGCVPHTVSLAYNDSINPVYLTDWNWDLGNGEVITGTPESLLYTYENPGAYTAILTVKDTNNCELKGSVRLRAGTIYVPRIDVVTSGDTICPLEFGRLYIYDDHDTCNFECSTQYMWQIGRSIPFRGYSFPYYEDWQFGTNPNNSIGDIEVWLSINHLGCDTTIQWNNTIYVKPPILYDILSSTTCEDHMTYSLSTLGEGIDYCDWYIYYLDQNEDTVYVFNELNGRIDGISVTFPEEREYIINVIAHNNNSDCIYEFSRYLSVGYPKAQFDLPSRICLGTSVRFDGNSSGYADLFKWDFGDGNETNWPGFPEAFHNYAQSGTYQVTLKARASHIRGGCYDSITKQITVVGANINIGMDESIKGCAPLLVEFTGDNISSDEGEISEIIWEFHNGSNISGNLVVMNYPDPGMYNLTVTAITTDNCRLSKTFLDLVQVSTVNAGLSIFPSTSCVGNSIQFVPHQNDSRLNYLWYFGDTVVNQPSFSHIFSRGGIYDITLKVENDLGCVKEEFKELRIEQPVADFVLAKDLYNCYPVQVDLRPQNSSLPQSMNLDFKWDMGNGNILELFHPHFVYNRPGTYDITFSVTSPYGCNDSKTETLTINGPFAEMYVSDTSICLGDEVSFKIINPQNVDSIMWVTGDGASYFQDSVSHSYTFQPAIGYYKPSLTLFSIGSEICAVPFTKDVHIWNTTADFDILDNSFNNINAMCSPFKGMLRNNSINDESINWYINGETYGNGDTLQKIVINNPGTQDATLDVKLVIRSEQGCMDSISKPVYVFALPSLNMSNDTLICFGDQISLFAEGGIRCEWSPDQYISDIHSLNPVVSPQQDIVYTAVIADQKGCINKDSVSVSIQFEPEIFLSTLDETIIIGDSTQIFITSDQENLTYLWSPSYNISCEECNDPYLFPLESKTYYLTVLDSVNCFRNNFVLNIIVDEHYTIDVPTAFTPQTNDENSIVYVKGHGIKQLLQFSIYNRWGEEVFFSDNLYIGWNGHFNNKLQNMDTYTYYVEAEMHDGSVRKKKGNIMLIR